LIILECPACGQVGKLWIGEMEEVEGECPACGEPFTILYHEGGLYQQIDGEWLRVPRPKPVGA